MKLTEKQKQRLKKQLLVEKVSLEKTLAGSDHFGLSQSLRDATGDLSVNDNHPGDLATEIYDRGKDIALNEHTELQLADVELALEHMQSGDYGKCLVCGKDIPYARLEALPATQYCKEHSPEQIVSNRRPAEEKFLQPPFGRTSLDDRDDQTQFDGEDAWQIVESWGNSNSPAMTEDPEALDYNNLYVESDENVGYVEPIESFLATDLYNQQHFIVRNNEYRNYMERNEGDHLLEPDELEQP